MNIIRFAKKRRQHGRKSRVVLTARSITQSMEWRIVGVTKCRLNQVIKKGVRTGNEAVYRMCVFQSMWKHNKDRAV
jgi:hypothetical protein